MKIGIAGHQRLENPSAWGWVQSVLSHELDALVPPLVALCSLAIGADQLFASMVAQRDGHLHAVLPFPEYERTFGPQDVDAYRRILSRATSVEVLHTHGADEDKYLAAGKRIVELADLMIAIWDGKPAKGKGGTADIVAYALRRGSQLISINPVERSIAKWNAGLFQS
jgi:hypothetical protein